MQKIIVSMKTLKEKLLEIEEDGMDLVEIRFIPGQIDKGSISPSFIHFEGISQKGVYKDYEGIDEFLIADCLLLHKSA